MNFPSCSHSLLTETYFILHIYIVDTDLNWGKRGVQFFWVILSALTWLLTIISWLYAVVFATQGVFRPEHHHLKSFFFFIIYLGFCCWIEIVWNTSVWKACKKQKSRSGINHFYLTINTVCTNAPKSGWHEVLNFSRFFWLARCLPTGADANCCLSLIYFTAHWQYVKMSHFLNTAIAIISRPRHVFKKKKKNNSIIVHRFTSAAPNLVHVLSRCSMVC